MAKHVLLVDEVPVGSSTETALHAFASRKVAEYIAANGLADSAVIEGQELVRDDRHPERWALRIELSATPALTVAALRQALGGFPDDARVMLTSCCYSDYEATDVSDVDGRVYIN